MLSVENAETQVINPLILLQYLIIYRLHIERFTAGRYKKNVLAFLKAMDISKNRSENGG